MSNLTLSVTKQSHNFKTFQYFIFPMFAKDNFVV